MEAQSVSQKYALAIFSRAVEKWLAALRLVHDKLLKDANLARSLKDRAKSFNDKKKALDRVIPGGTGSDIRNLLYTMLRDDCLDKLGDVLDELERMARGGPGVHVARIVTAIALTDADKDKFRQKLRLKYGRDLEFAFEVDANIMGGAVVQIGDKVIDGSLAGRLESLGQAIGIKK